MQGPSAGNPAPAQTEGAVLAHSFLRDVTRVGPQRAMEELATALGRDSAERWLDCARTLLQADAAPAAGAILEAARQLWPDQLVLRYWLGNAHRQAGDWRGAQRLFREVLAERPDHEDAALSLAFMLRERGRYSAAAQVILDLAKQQPQRVDLVLRHARFLKECRREALAEELCQEALRSGAADARLLVVAGNMAMSLGRFEQAREHFERAAALRPDDFGNLFLLTHTQRYSNADHADFARLRSAWANIAAPEEMRGIAGFGLGKALDDVGDFAAAAAVFREANRLLMPSSPWDAVAWRSQLERSSRDIPGLPQPFDPDVVPVFVVGMPRSGTTLVAERLGRFPQVRNRDELHWIEHIAAHLGAGAAAPDRPALRNAAAMYLTYLREDDAPARWYIDKNPLNFRHLKLIEALFPNARVILCRRNLRDTALSIWTQHFAHSDLYFSHRFADIAEVAEAFERVVETVVPKLRVPVTVVEYEDLARNPDQCIARLCEFAGIAQVQPAASPTVTAAIATASVWQVRQPVYQRSVGRWQAYAPHVPELLEFPVASG